MHIQAHALAQVPRSGDQADAGRCQVCWRYTECAQCFGWVPPGIQSTCFCSLLRHLAYFQIRAGNSVCTNRAMQKSFRGVWEIGGYQVVALACLLRRAYPDTRLMFHLRIIVISSQSFFDGFFGFWVQIPTALFAHFRTFGAYTDSTFCEVLAVWCRYRQHFQPFLTDFRVFDAYIDSTFCPFLDFSCIYRQHFL